MKTIYLPLKKNFILTANLIVYFKIHQSTLPFINTIHIRIKFISPIKDKQNFITHIISLKSDHQLRIELNAHAIITIDRHIDRGKQTNAQRYLTIKMKIFKNH